MFETLDIIKYSFLAGCSILAVYKLIVAIIIFDKNNLFDSDKNEKSLEAVVQYPILRFMKYLGFIMLLITLGFYIVYKIDFS